VTCLIIADPGLVGMEGHHLHYSAGVAEAALARGLTPLILAGASFQGTVADGAIRCDPWFSARYQTSGGGGWPRQALFAAASHLPAAFAGALARSGRGFRRQLRRNGTAGDPFGGELARALAELGGERRDLVLLHSVSAANLASLAEAVPTDLIGGLLIVLRRPPADMDRDDPGPEPIAEILHRLRVIHGTKLILYADTDLLAALFVELTGQPVHIVPPPVAVPADIAVAQPRSGPPHLVFIGGARLEKNYHRLPDIVAACQGLARFSLQSGPVGAASDPLIQRAHRALREVTGPTLRLIEQPLPTAEYWGLLASADFVLLPYDATAYGPRSSGILVEALALGIPALVPAGCWMARAGGTTRTEIMRGADDAVDATRRAIARLPELSSEAAAARHDWSEHHSAETLVATLLAPVHSLVANT
jgi:hypothetical protein